MANLSQSDYDAVVVGSGPNGLAAAIALRQEGLSVLVIEGSHTIGGGMRTAELTLPGFKHDVCSAIHPLAAASPFLSTLPLEQYGLQYIYPPVSAAHPFDDGSAAALSKSLTSTAQQLGEDAGAYRDMIDPVVRDWPQIADRLLGPLRFPHHPRKMARFGLKALKSAYRISRKFSTEKAKGFWAGMTAHSIMPLTSMTTAAVGLVLMAAGHLRGWPFPKGGSQMIADSMAAHFIALGGKIQTGFWVKSLDALPSARVFLLDVTPRQLLAIAGQRFSAIYTWQLKRYRYGPGVFKIDWALDGPVPFTAPQCREAATIHIGGSFADIAAAEQAAWDGRHTEKPFVLMAQQSVFDNTRAPEGKHTAWAYCHVPHGSTVDMSDAIEKQVERFAPGFRDRVIGRHTLNTAELARYNPNYVGGDIGGGALDLGQLFTRPVLRRSPYRTSAGNIYICSSSTPPGGGVHGMCGYHAARRALKDSFGLD